MVDMFLKLLLVALVVTPIKIQTLHRRPCMPMRRTASLRRPYVVNVTTMHSSIISIININQIDNFISIEWFQLTWTKMLMMMLMILMMMLMNMTMTLPMMSTMMIMIMIMMKFM